MPGGLDPGQESECGSGLSLVILPKPRTGSAFRQAKGQGVVDWRWSSYNNFALKAMVAACPVPVNHVRLPL